MDKMNRKKIIVFNYSIPRHDMSSGERRFVGILKIMAKHYDVDLCVVRYGKWLTNQEFTAYSDKLKSYGINVLEPRPDSLQKAIKEKEYDFAYFEFFWIAEESMREFCKAQPKAVTIVDSVDVHFAREESQAELGQITHKQARRTKKREVSIYKAADIAVAVSNPDIEILKNEGVKNIHYLPNVVDTVQRAEGERANNVLFIGGYKWHPNVDAVRWFSTDIWPSIIREVPDAIFQIVGSDPDEEILKLDENPGIEVLGFVPETKPYLDNAAVSVAPLRYGGGMKGKVNEAMAHGLPVVATSFGAQGFNAVEGEEILIGDDPKIFAQKVVTLLKDKLLQEKIGLKGQMLNDSLCSVRVVEENILNMMNDAEEILKQKAKSGGNRKPVPFSAGLRIELKKRGFYK